jgi:hypothetical protein
MKRWIAAGIAVLPLLGVSPGLAQEPAVATLAPGGFSFTLPADVTVGRDHGFLANNQKLSDNIGVIRLPQMSFINNSPRSNLTLSYQPEGELFQHNRRLDAINQTAAFALTYRITERLRFKATDDALQTHDPTRSIAGSLIFLPRRNFEQNLAHAAVDYDVSPKNTLTFGFDNVAASAPLNTLAFPGTGHVRNSGTVSLDHKFTPKQTLTATYSVLTAGAQFGGAAYEGQFAGDLTVNLSAGLLEDGGENYLMSGDVEKRFGTIWVSAGYHRFLSIYGTPIQGGIPIGNDLVLPDSVSRTNVYQVFSTAISGKLSNRAGIELDGEATRNKSGIAGRDINNWASRLKLTYGVTDRLKIYTDLQLYSQTYNVFVGAPIDRQRYLAGILFDVSEHPNRVSNHPEPTRPSQR